MGFLSAEPDSGKQTTGSELDTPKMIRADVSNISRTVRKAAENKRR